MTSIDYVEVAVVALPVATTLKSLDVILDQRLTFNEHATAVVKSCNYHARAIRHVRHLLTESVAQTLACSRNRRLDYCNSLLYGAPEATVDKLQRAQNNAARAVLSANGRADARPLLRQLHWLPVCQHIFYKTAVLVRRANTTGVPVYLKEHLVQRVPSRQTCSAVPVAPLLSVPRLTTDFARRSFSYAAPVIWNSLPTEVMLCDLEHGFKRHLKTFLFNCCHQTVWKMANVLHLAKVHPPLSIDSDLRPIAMTPTISKHLEAIVGGFILEAVADKLDPKQFGGLKGRSTTRVLVDMLHHWHAGLDSGVSTRVLFIDFAKAVDDIDHNEFVFVFRCNYSRILYRFVFQIKRDIG